MNYYNEIKENLLKSEIYDKIKDYSKDRNKVNVYYETGKLLSEAGKEYGKNIIKQYSDKLMKEVGKKYNERNLRYMRQFYEIFEKEFWNIACSKLSWSHYREVLSIKNINAIKYYLNECENKILTIKQLKNIIKNKEYDRLSNETKNKLIKNEQLKVNDLIPNPIFIRTIKIKESITEYALKQAILAKIDDFIFQLGKGFSYIGSEYKIKIGNVYNYIDLLMYNIKYKSYIVIELKVTELKKEHIGQIEIYMNYIDKNIKTIEEDKTIGIIICKKDNKFIMEYCSDKRILSKEYKII